MVAVLEARYTSHVNGLEVLEGEPRQACYLLAIAYASVLADITHDTDHWAGRCRWLIDQQNRELTRRKNG